MIRNSIPAREGDSLREDFDPVPILEKLLTIPGVKNAHIAPICCDDERNGWMLYIGIKEDTADDFNYRPTPNGSQIVPASLLEDYNQFESLIREAVMKRQGSEDDSQGYAYMTYPPAKPIQERFLEFARNNLPLLLDVLKNSADPLQRAVAAWIIPFSPDKSKIVPDLLLAVHDKDETVRNNATRALSILAKYATDHPTAGISIPWQDFIGMIRSLSWTDRNKGLAVLEALTKKRDLYLLKALKEQALADIIEMAAWKNTGHAFYAFVILGRLAGVTDEIIFGNLDTGYERRLELVNTWAGIVRAQ